MCYFECICLRVKCLKRDGIDMIFRCCMVKNLDRETIRKWRYFDMDGFVIRPRVFLRC